MKKTKKEEGRWRDGRKEKKIEPREGGEKQDRSALAWIGERSSQGGDKEKEEERKEVTEEEVERGGEWRGRPVGRHILSSSRSSTSIALHNTKGDH